MTCPGINGDPLLGPLEDNGGPTQTMALGFASAAIDAGDDSTCAAAPVNNRDQRGITRPQGPHCDIGALNNSRIRRCPPNCGFLLLVLSDDHRRSFYGSSQSALFREQPHPRPLAGLASATDWTVVGPTTGPRTTGDRDFEPPGFAPGMSVPGTPSSPAGWANAQFGAPRCEKRCILRVASHLARAWAVLISSRGKGYRTCEPNIS